MMLRAPSPRAPSPQPAYYVQHAQVRPINSARGLSPGPPVMTYLQPVVQAVTWPSPTTSQPRVTGYQTSTVDSARARIVGVPAPTAVPVAEQNEQDPLRCIDSIDIGREINAVALSPDGRRVVFGLQDHSVQIWDLEAQVVTHVLKGHKYWVNSVAFSIDGQRVASASADKSVKVWNAATGQCEATVFGHMLSVAAVAFSDDASRIASGSWDKTVCIWDVDTCCAAGPTPEGHIRPVTTLSGHTDWVHSVAWAPGGRRLASASSDHSVRVWSTITGVVEQVLVGHLQTVSSVSFAKSGIFLVSGSLDRTVRVWNVQEGVLSARLQQDCDGGSVHSVAFAPDCDKVVVGCSDKSVKVWNFRTGEQEARLQGHEEAVFGVAVTPDGNRIVSCSHDKTARVWRMPCKSNRLNGSPGAGVQPDASVVAGSFQELHDRLRSTEDTNQRLRKQLFEAQTQIEENTRGMQQRDNDVGEQERQLSSYKDMVSSLKHEKERLEKSFEEMRQEMRTAPVAPAGMGPSSGSAVGSAHSPLASAMSLGRAGAGRNSGRRTDAGPSSSAAASQSQLGSTQRQVGKGMINQPAGSSVFGSPVPWEASRRGRDAARAPSPMPCPASRSLSPSTTLRTRSWSPNMYQQQFSGGGMRPGAPSPFAMPPPGAMVGQMRGPQPYPMNVGAPPYAALGGVCGGPRGRIL